MGIDLLNEFDQPGPIRLVGMVAFDRVGTEDRVQLDLSALLLGSAAWRRFSAPLASTGWNKGADRKPTPVS